LRASSGTIAATSGALVVLLWAHAFLGLFL